MEKSQSKPRSMLSNIAAAAGSAQQFIQGWPSRYTADDDVSEHLTFQDLDSGLGDYFEGTPDGPQSKKTDTDFFNNFEDDFDESDMKMS